MNDIDFSACEFIDECLRFLTYDDFCRNSKIIKLLYSGLEKDAKRFYKWYVYANIHIDEVRKNVIWEFLNYDEPEYYQKLLWLRKTYRMR